MTDQQWPVVEVTVEPQVIEVTVEPVAPTSVEVARVGAQGPPGPPGPVGPIGPGADLLLFHYLNYGSL